MDRSEIFIFSILLFVALIVFSMICSEAFTHFGAFKVGFLALLLTLSEFGVVVVLLTHSDAFTFSFSITSCKGFALRLGDKEVFSHLLDMLFDVTATMLKALEAPIQMTIGHSAVGWKVVERKLSTALNAAFRCCHSSSGM